MGVGPDASTEPRSWGWELQDQHPLYGYVRRCPTLPQPPGCSTIGAVGLSFRVRDGTGRFPHAIAAVTLSPVNPLLGLWEICYYVYIVVCIRLCVPLHPVAAVVPLLGVGLWCGDRLVDANLSCGGCVGVGV